MERSPQCSPPTPNLVKYFFSHTKKFTSTLKRIFSLGTMVATTTLLSCGGGGGGGGGAAGGQAYSPLSCTVDWDCPTGFVPVCGNPVLGTSDFCVMKFEAKNVGGVATSQTGDTYWTLTPPNAYSSCNSLTATNFDGDFALISNRQWMTLARAIEAMASNWSGGAVGRGHLARGHSDNSPNAFLAVTDEDDPWDGTEQDGSEAGGAGWEQRRTHDLPGGGVVWDLAGNATESVDWDASDNSYTGHPTTGLTEGTKEFSAPLEGELTANDVLPAGSYTSAHSVGVWEYGPDPRGSAAFRGGWRASSTNGGVFHLLLGLLADGSASGFRCVYLP